MYMMDTIAPKRCNYLKMLLLLILKKLEEYIRDYMPDNILHIFIAKIQFIEKMFDMPQFIEMMDFEQAMASRNKIEKILTEVIFDK